MKVYPNLGAEEGFALEALPPRATEAVDAFCWLFGRRAEVIGREPAPWPEALGPAPDAPLFDWISGEGFAWLANDEAQTRLEEAGVRPHLPESALVAMANDKALAHRIALRHGLLPEVLRPLIEVFEAGAIRRAEVEARVDALPSWVGKDWVLKPRQGSSGRGRVRRIEDVAGATARLDRRGGALFEPWLAREEDLSALLHLDPEGSIQWLGTTRQILRGAGVYQGSRGLLLPGGEVRAGSPWDEDLREAAEIVARSIAATGYFGPLGIDAFSFVGPGGEILLRPVVEANARFTMGFVALGLLLHAHRRGILPAPAAWTFSVAGREEGESLLPLGESIRLGWSSMPAEAEL